MTTMTLTKTELAQFTGSETWHRHSIVRDVLFTDGAKHLAISHTFAVTGPGRRNRDRFGNPGRSRRRRR
jgi:hypothetical protein